MWSRQTDYWPVSPMSSMLSCFGKAEVCSLIAQNIPEPARPCECVNSVLLLKLMGMGANRGPDIAGQP